MGTLRGKGVWVLYSRRVDLAIEMALAIGATHVFCKVGDRGVFFVETAHRLRERAREAGLIPFAWFPIVCDDPYAEAEVAIKAMRAGYKGVVFSLGEGAAGKAIGAAALGRRVLEGGLDPERLFYASFPNIWQHPDLPYREMNGFCRGGFMPWCFPTFRRTPRTVIRKWAYGEHARWAAEWGGMPPLYPVLAAYRDEQAAQRLTPREFLEWAEVLAAEDPPFYSVYRAGTTDRALWPILAALGEGAPPPAPVEAIEEVPPEAEEGAEPPSKPAPPEEPAPAAGGPEEEEEEAPPPIYHVVTVNDTIWSLCDRYGITREQFWEWNGHLWDERSLPRDELYLQEGWRVRVG